MLHSSLSLARVRGRALAAALSVLALSAPAPAQTICLIAELEAAQQVPPNGSPAKGTGCFVLDPVANSLTFEITFDGLLAAETAAHIHGYAGPGANAGPQFGLPAGNNKAGVWFYPPGDEARILAGLAYVNIHSAVNPGGEIRGQIVRDVSNATLIGRIDGAQVPNGSPALGTSCFSIDTTTNTLSYLMTFTRSTLLGAETNAHIHGFAGPGANAGVLTGLPPGFHKKGTWVYAEAQEANILAGLTYVNIHSSVFPNGEIRGQMTRQCSCDPNFQTYCTAGTSVNGCMATISVTGIPSATLPSGFKIAADNAEGNKNGIFFYGTNGRQANAWGNGTSFQCVIPPVRRGGLITSSGTTNACDGSFSQDLNARWCPSCPKPSHNPGVGATMQGQLWYRDPTNTSNQTTSLSDAAEWIVCP